MAGRRRYSVNFTTMVQVSVELCLGYCQLPEVNTYEQGECMDSAELNVNPARF